MMKMDSGLSIGLDTIIIIAVVVVFVVIVTAVTVISIVLSMRRNERQQAIDITRTRTRPMTVPGRNERPPMFTLSDEHFRYY